MTFDYKVSAVHTVCSDHIPVYHSLYPSSVHILAEQQPQLIGEVLQKEAQVNHATQELNRQRKRRRRNQTFPHAYLGEPQMSEENTSNHCKEETNQKQGDFFKN